MSSVTLVSSSGKSFAPPTEEQGSTEGSSCYGDQLVEGEGPVIERGSIADMIEPKLTQSQPKIVQSGLLTRYLQSVLLTETTSCVDGTCDDTVQC